MTRARYTVMLIILGTATLIIVSFLKGPTDNAANSVQFVAYQYREDTNTEQRHNQELNKKQEGESTRTDTWRRVSETHRIFVYSAFLDYSLPDRIRIIGVIPNSCSHRLWCEYRLENSICRARVYIANINESHYKMFTAVYLLCYLCPGTEIPSSVSIFETEETKVTLAVHMVPQAERYLNIFSICIAPLNRRYNDVPQLIEWLELNIMFGVTHFTFYNLSASNDVAKVLDYYERLGLARVLTWNVDIMHNTLLFTDKELHYFGQLAAINDCLYRHKTLSKYIAVIDLDELIVPRDNQDFAWNDMFNRLPTASEYMFRMALFRKEAGFSQTPKSHLRTLTMTHRDDFIYPEYHISKVIVRTTDITVLGIHNTWGVRHPGSRHIVNTSIGMLHHYRDASINDFHTEIRVIKDRTMYKYKRIVNRYDKVMRETGIQIEINKTQS